MDIRLNRGFVIPATALSVETSRSSGPGGQHVNKTETRVTLRWSLAESELPASIKARLRAQLASRLTKAEELLVSVDDTRVQSRNLVLAHERLRDLLNKALYVPKKRRPTRRTRGSQERRLRAKRAQSEKKSMRKKPVSD